MEFNHNSSQPLEIANDAQVEAVWNLWLGTWTSCNLKSLEISITHFISHHHTASLGFILSPTFTFPFCHILYLEATQVAPVWVWTLPKYVLYVSIWRFMTFSMSIAEKNHWQQARNVKVSTGKQYRQRDQKKREEVGWTLFHFGGRE